MDDTKRYKIQIKGTAYSFSPIPDEDLGKIQVIFNMNASAAKTLKALTRILKNSAGAEQWDALTDRLIDDEIGLEEIIKPAREILKRQVKDRTAAPADE